MAESVVFGQPWGLLLFLAVPALFVVGRRRVAALGTGRGRVALALRLVVSGLLALALADPRLLVPDQRLSVMFALDVSSSVPSDQQAAANAWVAQALQAAQPDDQGGVITFAGQPVVQQWSLGSKPPTSGPGPAPLVDASGMDLSAALRLAGELAGAGSIQPRVVLLTAGWETTNHARDTLAWLTSHGVSVSYVPLVAPISAPEVAVQRLDAPTFVRDGETADLTVTLASNFATQAILTLSEDGKSQVVHPVELSPGATVVPLRYTANGQRTHILTAEIKDEEDSLTDNNRAEAAIVVKPRAKVLMIEQRAGEADALATGLTAQRMDIERKDPQAVPVRGDDLAAYDALVLVDVKATNLSLDQQETIQAFVHDMGRGLMVVGGENSFSMGAYADTHLERMLPVLASPPDRREHGDLALLLVIDGSGSMSLAYNHVVKLAMAKEAAMQAAAVLKPTDTIGVLTFNTKYQWVVTPQLVADNGGLPGIQSRISTIKAAGGTDIYTALDAAFQAMAQTTARFRHVLLLTDGQSPSAGYQSLVSRNQALGITLSTVGIGADADTQLLTQLAQLGNGRSYATQRFDDIPSIVAKETQIASRSALAEGRFQPSVFEPSPLLTELDVAPMPRLGGYVQTTARPGATVALISPRQDPILAHWHYGLGRVVTWTSDAGETWAADWMGSSEAAAFFSRAVRWSMAAPVDPRLSVSAEVEDTTITLRAESIENDGAFGDGLDTRATVVTPGGDAIEVSLPQSGPGLYQRKLAVSDPGVYHILVRQVRPSGEVLEEVSGVVIDSYAHTRSIGTNRALLESLAGQTGGRMLSTPAEAFARDFAPRSRWLPVWPWVLAAGLLLFPLDIALRRLHLPAWRATFRVEL